MKEEADFTVVASSPRLPSFPNSQVQRYVLQGRMVVLSSSIEARIWMLAAHSAHCACVSCGVQTQVRVDAWRAPHPRAVHFKIEAQGALWKGLAICRDI